jgi:hypothetical protein
VVGVRLNVTMTPTSGRATRKHTPGASGSDGDAGAPAIGGKCARIKRGSPRRAAKPGARSRNLARTLGPEAARGGSAQDHRNAEADLGNEDGARLDDERRVRRGKAPAPRTPR